MHYNILYFLANNSSTLDDCKEFIEFLKNNVSPWNKIVANWKKTYAYRQKILESNSYSEYFQKFPCLKQPVG